MDEIKIQTFNELHNLIENYDPRTVIYRGVKSVYYPLIPKIGRIVSRCSPVWTVWLPILSGCSLRDINRLFDLKLGNKK